MLFDYKDCNCDKFVINLMIIVMDITADRKKKKTDCVTSKLKRKKPRRNSKVAPNASEMVQSLLEIKKKFNPF